MLHLWFYPFEILIAGSTVPIRLVMGNYEDYKTNLKINGEASEGAIVREIFLLFPLLLTTDFKASHTYELIPGKR